MEVSGKFYRRIASGRNRIAIGTDWQAPRALAATTIQARAGDPTLDPESGKLGGSPANLLIKQGVMAALTLGTRNMRERSTFYIPIRIVEPSPGRPAGGERGRGRP
jgi:hypothetical protein